MESEDFETREARVLGVDGQRLFAALHLPLTGDSVPVVVISHGFAGHKVGSRRLYVLMAEALARSGIATLRYDFRGCGDSEGYFCQVTVDSLVEDAVAALNEVRSCPRIDKGRIGLIGASLGGAVSVLAAHRTGWVKSLSLWAPVADGKQWETDWLKQFPPDADADTVRFLEEPMGEGFCVQFLSTRADSAMAKMSEMPLMHVHGGEDEVVRETQRNAFLEAREGATGPSHFMILPNSGHQFVHPAERQVLIQETTDWFRKTLG